MSGTVTDPRSDRAFFGHPRGLANLFGVEVWERFSYYGMLASLTLYLYYEVAGDNPGLGLPEATATSLVGAYGGLVYVSTIAGCWVADRVLGAERTLFYSAILVMIGHIALAVLPGFVGLGVGLACVALGSGGVKGNATAVVGTLYAENDDRRDAGFSIFYMGIKYRWVARTAAHRAHSEHARLPLRLRCGRRRHGHRPDPIHARPAQSGC